MVCCRESCLSNSHNVHASRGNFCLGKRAELERTSKIEKTMQKDLRMIGQDMHGAARTYRRLHATLKPYGVKLSGGGKNPFLRHLAIKIIVVIDAVLQSYRPPSLYTPDHCAMRSLLVGHQREQIARGYHRCYILE